MRRTHGRSGTRIYLIWQNLRKRCLSPDHPQYKNYGGRGITVCEEWRGKHGFLAFLDWALANGYQDDLFIDREENDIGYSPENCRWVTRVVNNNNRRVNVFIAAFGESKTPAEWSRDPRCRVTSDTLNSRVKEGWPVESAITTETFKKGSSRFYSRRAA